MSYLTVKGRRGRLGDLGMIGWGGVRPPAPGTTEASDLRRAFNTATYDTAPAGWNRVNPDRASLCAWVTKSKWKPFLQKRLDLMALYPEAMKANELRCFPTMIINGKIVGTDRDSNMQNAVDWYNANGRDGLVNLDLSPAVNTVARGTPKSWNVIGMMPQNKGSYGYAFMDEAAARNYAQAIVDAGGSATLYQEPDTTVVAPAPPVITQSGTAVPVTTPGSLIPAPVYNPSAPYVPSYGPTGGATQYGTPTGQPLYEEGYKQPGAVIVAPTSTAQGMPVALDQSTMTVPAQQESGGIHPLFLLAIPAAIFMMKK